jgi:hypothetical protein
MKYKKTSISVLLRSDRTVFSFQDICLLWGITDTRAAIAAVNYYVRTGDLFRIRRGVYAKDRNYDRQELASRIYTPAYVSFETVLVGSGINFQHYGQIFIASYLSREIDVDGQVYVYHRIKDSVLIEPSGIVVASGRSIATPERAVLDTVYLNKDYHFDNLSSLDWDQVFRLLPLYDNKRMAQKVNEYYSNYQASK